MEDSPMMTIEYLRARLLSERLVSKAAKERADELAKRVEKLEEQLKIVTYQRRRAEKATLDVLSYLESHGVSDISEVYESDSDEEESLCKSNMGIGETAKEDRKVGSLEIEGNVKESSGSEHESTPSSGRSLSWKGRKESTQVLEKKYLDSPIQRLTSLPQVNSSPRHRLGKSCRQIKRREMRSAGEESRPDSAKSDAQIGNGVDCFDQRADCLGYGTEESKKSPGRQIERGFKQDKVSLCFQAEVQLCDASSSTHEPECYGEMERALRHQAHLIGRYEAQEKAQRDWEEKYGENNDSCEPGSHSDITEERDENKVAVPHPGGMVACHGHDQKAGKETNLQAIKPSVTHFNSFKLSPHADTGCSESHNFNEMQPSTSPAPDFAFSVVTSKQTQEHAESHSLHEGHIAPSSAASAFYEPQQLQNLKEHTAFLPNEESSRLQMVLEALQEAKLLMKRHVDSLPETSGSVGRAVGTSNPAVRDMDWLKIPVGCPSLFRVPTDLQSQAPSQIRSLGSDYPSSELTNSYLFARAPALQGTQNSSRNMNSGLSIPRLDTLPSNSEFGSELGISNGPPRFDFLFNTNVSSSKSSVPPYSSFPNFFPHMSSNQILKTFTNREAGIPPSGYPSFRGHDVRANMYR